MFRENPRGLLRSRVMTEGDPHRPDENPYAPPAGSPGSENDGEGPRTDYASQKQAVLALIGLSVITCGVYASVWYVQRRDFLDARSVEDKLGGLPHAALLAHIVTVFMSLFGGDELVPVANLISIPSAVLSLVLAFRVARILRTDLANAGIPVPVSLVGTFFFGAYYLQYKINRAAEWRGD